MGFWRKKFPHKRTFLGLLVQPQKQLRFALLFTGGAMLTTVALVGFTAIVFNHTLKNLVDSEMMHAEIGFLLKDTMVIPFVLLTMGAFLLGLFCVYLGIRMSNRIYGPIIPLKRHIENLKQGYYGSRVTLRRNDELEELRDALNDLAAVLESRYPQK